MNRQQLEMSFESPVAFRPVIRRHRRMIRARWWFEQMRQVVDRAWDSEPALPVRPEQVCLTLAQRHERN
ncbi:MAG TPA: hypothetical protein VN887_04020 [Candidatus Angelobacter sp.]|nr:hypothetical protein [Candidatus Angelobacter sp.]